MTQTAPDRRIALIAAGPTRHSIFDVVPGLRRRVGPIAATSSRVSSRIANTLRHGWPASEDDELLDHKLILAYGPGARIDEIVERFRRLSPIPRGGKLLLVTSARPDEHLPLTAGIPGVAFGSALALRDTPPIVLLQVPARWQRLCRSLIIEASARPFFCDEAPGQLYDEIGKGIAKASAMAGARLRKAGIPAPDANALAAYLWSQRGGSRMFP
jgi:hypothetical protein